MPCNKCECFPCQCRKMDLARKYGSKSCDACGCELGLKGGFSGLDLCGPCCTGEADTLEDKFILW